MRLDILLFTLSSSTSLALSYSLPMDPAHSSVHTLSAADRHIGERVTRQRHLREEPANEARNYSDLAVEIKRLVKELDSRVLEQADIPLLDRQYAGDYKAFRSDLMRYGYQTRFADQYKVFKKLGIDFKHNY